jgi:hypothetical protein
LGDRYEATDIEMKNGRIEASDDKYCEISDVENESEKYYNDESESKDESIRKRDKNDDEKEEAFYTRNNILFA